MGGILASVLGLALLYCSTGKKKTQNSMENVRGKAMKSSKQEICQSGNDMNSDVIIVGEGVAGSTLAYTLAKDGRRVRVIERDLSLPDRIVGELLQPRGYLKLIELGLEYCVEDIDAQLALGYALYKDWRSTELFYALKSFDVNVAGTSFHNGRFIQKMREKASSLPNSEIRCLVGIPAGKKLPSISNGEMANYLKTVVAPQIPQELIEAFLSAIKKGNIRTMPNRSMPAAPYPTPGALLLGDAFNMKHHLTGGGMTVALSDIVILRDLLRPLHDLSDSYSLCKYPESFYTLRKPVASTINTLAGALYKVLSASTDPARNEMRQACFDYLSLGGVFSSGSIGFLSGLNPHPLSPVLHFFAMAIYGVGRLIVPFPSATRMWIGARMISVASRIIFPIIRLTEFDKCSSLQP